MNEGRRGRRIQKALDKEARRVLKVERALQNERKEREQALARILPRLRRWSKLSDLGIVFVTSKDGRNTYYSLEGVADPGFWGGGESGPGIFVKWAQIHVSRLAIIAKIKKFQIFQPKNAMVVLAEAFAGRHDDIF